MNIEDEDCDKACVDHTPAVNKVAGQEAVAPKAVWWPCWKVAWMVSMRHWL